MHGVHGGQDEVPDILEMWQIVCTARVHGCSCSAASQDSSCEMCSCVYTFCCA